MRPARPPAKPVSTHIKHERRGFARIVGMELRVVIQGLPDGIVDNVHAEGPWHSLPNGIAAAASASAGKLVLGGLPVTSGLNTAITAMQWSS
jgi:hypothetical protein